MPGELRIQRVEGTMRAGEAADWIEAEWGALPIVESLRDSSERTASESCQLPITYGGLVGEEFVATISILNNDLPGYPDLNPWIGCLIVHSDYRRQGFGNAMLLHAETASADLGYVTLYLFTEEPLTAYYDQRGWRGIEWATDHGQPVLIMSKSVSKQRIVSTG